MKRTWSCWALVGLLVAFGLTYSSVVQAQQVVINEIHYHPSAVGVEPPTDPESLQFIELYNAGPAAVDLSGWSFGAGVEFIFPGGASIPVHGFVVVADDPTFLRSMVPSLPADVPVFQVAAGSDLNNAGEQLVLLNSSSSVVDDVTYDDAGLWPAAADGSGASLELIHPAYDNAYPLVWKASVGTNGTPGQVNSRFTEGPAILREDPARSSVVPSLTQVEVVFAESVTGVVAGDLTVAASPATSVTGSGAGPYVFTGFAAPTQASVSVTLGPGAIQDLEAHAYAGDTWIYSLAVPKIVINEINYNPTVPDDLTEFVELFNADVVAVDLTGWTLMEFASPGVTFPAGTVLQPGDYLVAAKDPATLEAQLGCVTSHTWGIGDSLSNGGEPVTLKDAGGVVVDRVFYDNVAPWPTAPDGQGPSLERTNPASGAPCTAALQSSCNWQASAWRASTAPSGSTCGAQNSVYTTAPLVTATDPIRNAVIDVLNQVSVTFSEPVTGVTADDLTVDGVAATGVSGSGGAGPYVFTVNPPVPGTLDVVLRGDGGIVDLQAVPFPGDSWLYFNGLPRIVINELHYHPSVTSVLTGENPEDLQFLELYNDGTETIDLTGFRLSSGVSFTFPAGTTMDPGEFLVVAENAAFLQTKATIPGGVTVLQWASGDLANGGETVELSDSYGHVLDSVPYDDGGEWASAPDGDGPSLELVNADMPNQYGNAWRASLASLGTPGAANGRYAAVPPPIVSAVHHDPPIPGANQLVTITAFALDESVTPTVWLQYRLDQEPTIAYTAVQMLDDGLHGDGAAGDDVYGVVLAGLAEGQRLDFAIQASDGVAATVAPIGHNGVFPGAGGHPPQVFLCKFSSAALPTDFPSYHLITTQYTANRQATRDKTVYDATFLRCPAGGLPSQCEVFYNASERFRGATSLYQNPPSYRIDLPGDHHMASEMGFTIKSLNMLAQQAARQGIGFGLFNDVGLPAPKYHYVRMSTSPLPNGGTQNWVYTNAERIDEDFFTSQDGAIQPLRFPERCEIAGTVCNNDDDCPAGDNCVNTDDGNCYRGRHDDSSLRWEGFDPNAYRVDASERNGYQKITREDEDEWTDLITLCDAMNCSPSDGGLLCLENDYDGWFQSNIGSYADAEQWARWLAIHMLLDNQEGGIYRDTGDDYFLYFWPGPGYGHATFVPWDLDAIIPSAHETIWRTGANNANWPLRRFVRNNANAGLFVGAICEYMDTVFSQAAMDARIDALPNVLFPTGTPQGSGAQDKLGMKSWVAAQRTAINNEIRRQTTLQGVPASPYESEDPVILLSGQLNQCWAREVRVNGVPANYTIANPGGVGASWTYNLTLNPGPNAIVVQTLDHNGAEIDRAEEFVEYAPPGTGEEQSLKLTMPTRMVNDKTFTLKAEVVDAIGRIDWRTWTALGNVSARRVSDQAPVPLTVTVFETYPAGTGSGGPPTTDSIRFYNGVGTVSFTFNDPASVADQDVEITVTVGELSGSRVIHALGNVPGIYRNLSGTLSGDGLTWSPGDGVIHLTGNVTVPSGSTLTIQPGTLIMAEPGPTGDGTQVIVNGAVTAPGTQAEPIFFFPAAGRPAMTLPSTNSANPSSWRGFTHTGTGTSTFSHAFVTGAGNAPVASHPRPLVFGVESSASLSLIDSIVADCGGKIIHMTGSGTITLRRTVWSRVGYGGEFLGGSHTLLAEDCWFTRIGRAPEANDADGDVMHLDNASSHQTVRRSIYADCGDDMIDHSGANPVVEDTIFWDGDDKTVSLSAGGSVTFDNVLVFGMPIGINGAGGIVRNSTITAGMPMGTVTSVNETIVWSSGIPSTGSCNGNINYTDAGNTNHIACGTGNINVNPQFESTASLAWDYDPAVGSPALTAGPTGGRIGWLGFPDGSICSTPANCDDGNACTQNTCVNGACVFEAIWGCEPCETVAECDDGDPCNVDGCSAGACTHTAGNNGAVCNDGWNCTINDLCTAGACVGTESCLPGQACSPTTGECVAGPVTVTFQQGVNGYAGTQDTYLYQSGPDTIEGAAITWRWDTDDPPSSGLYEYGLVRFDGIFGEGAGQIPVGATISSATLTIYIENGTVAPAGSVNEAAVDWSEAATTWNNFGGEAGVAADEYGALVAAAPVTGASVSASITVTSSLQAWSDGLATNYGWIFRPAVTDGVAVTSSEGATIANRPLLTVTYIAPVTTCTNNAQCDDGLFCNGAETCDLGASVCVPGTPPDCSFSMACAINTCNETTDTCDHVPNDAFCDDGDVCNGSETCSLLVGCQGGTALDCDDGIACTTDSCVSPTGCQHADNCTGGLTCNLTTGLCMAGPVTKTFQQGDANGYGGTVDTYIDTALPSQATTTPIVCDNSPAEHILLRFDGIFGPGVNQIPVGSTITSATLTLRVGSGTNDQCENPVNYHRLLHPWIATDVWAAYGVPPWNATGGIQADGVDALAAIEATATMITASTAYPVSVTGSVQAWANAPSSNYGWAILPTSADGLRLESSESTTVSYRPLLSVTYTPPVTTCTSDAQCTDGLWCNGTETCNLGTGLCETGTPPTCADTAACTTDSCNETTDSCDHLPNHAACSDGNVCTDDTCDVVLDCRHTNNTASCSDGNACTTGDTCSGGTCTAGGATDCDDGIACTTDGCNTSTGCTHVDGCTGGLVCNHTTGACETPTVSPLPISQGDTWKYFKGTAEPSTPVQLPPLWAAVGFDDSAWLEGPSGLGYDYYVETGGTNANGDYGPFIATELGDMRGCTPTNPPLCNAPGYLTVYLRKAFTVVNPAAVTSLTLRMYADDGYVAYLNGTEVARIRVTGTPPAYNVVATGGPSVVPPVEQTLDLTSVKGLLVPGVNVLAVQIHNATLDSRDLLVIPQLSSTESAYCTGDGDCNDSNPCTDDSCNLGTGVCSHTNNTNACTDDGIACTTDVCSGGACGHADSCTTGYTCNLSSGVCEVSSVTVTFRQGDAGYTGAVDTYINAGAATTSYAAATELTTDGVPPTTDERQTLIRFDEIFGAGVGQVPVGATITSATLTIYVSNATVQVTNWYRMLQTWNATDTWNTFGAAPWNATAGVQADGVEALATPDLAPASVAAGSQTLTVTPSVQAWATNPAANFGWVITTAPADTLGFYSAEYATVANRPRLSVTYTPPIAACTSDAQCTDGLWCNGTETCNLGTALCEAGTPPICTDAVGCTTDSCNETTDDCDHVPSDAACSDGNVCTDDTCSVALGCQYTNNTAPCSDGDACTTGDVCAAGACQAGTTPLTCDDDVACTTDSCLPASGCQYVDSCTGGQVCNHTTGLCSTTPVTMTFQQGDANAYGGTADTYIGSGLASQAASNPLVVDLDPVVEQALVRFDGIFGSGANQIPVGSTITSATLTLRVGGTQYDESPNPVAFHRLLHPWVDTGLWADYGVSPWNATAGIQADGAEALATADATTTLSALNTSYPVEVTASVQAWANDPSSNYGWVVLMTTGTDGLRVQSAESTTVSYRPLLSVTYTSPGTACTSDPECDDGLYCNGAETCSLGTLTCQSGTPPDCDDGVTCTVDSCNETLDACEHTPCAMTVVAEGSRYLAVTPPSGVTTVALRIRSEGLEACLPRYLVPDGTLGLLPEYRTPAEWGTVHVYAQQIAPGRLYTVEALRTGEVPIGSSSATTWAWGDTNNSDGIDIFDILCVLDGSQNKFVKCSLYATDLRGPTPNGVVDNDDIQAVLDAYESKPYPESDPCSGVTP